MRPMRREGFTLLEVTTAGGLLALMALGTGAALVSSSRANESLRDYDLAIYETQSKLQEITSWADFDTLITNFDARSFAIGTLEGTGGSGSLPGSIEIDATDPSLLRVYVRAQWTGPWGAQSLEMTTLVADPLVTTAAD